MKVRYSQIKKEKWEQCDSENKQHLFINENHFSFNKTFS